MFTATVQDSMETKKEDNMDGVSNWFTISKAYLAEYHAYSQKFILSS